MGDEQQFQQVMINLLINAMDAMPEGGRLIVNSEHYSDTEDSPHTSSSQSGVKITIRDTGVGIPGKNINEIFDPFFTTKDPGKGTGLGLSVSLRIIESFGGKISVESSPGEGTEFTIKIPTHA
jgi:signal transduction histidine kinase